MVKNLPANAGDALGSIHESERFPGGGNGNPISVFLLGKFHGQRSLGDYSPGGCKELDMIEQLSTTHYFLPCSPKCLRKIFRKYYLYKYLCHGVYKIQNNYCSNL